MKGNPAVRRHCAEQLLQRLEPTRRGADPDDRKLSHGLPPAIPRLSAGEPLLPRPRNAPSRLTRAGFKSYAVRSDRSSAIRVLLSWSLQDRTTFNRTGMPARPAGTGVAAHRARSRRRSRPHHRLNVSWGSIAAVGIAARLGPLRDPRPDARCWRSRQARRMSSQISRPVFARGRGCGAGPAILERHDLARVHDVVRVERLLDRTHRAHRPAPCSASR